MFLAHGDPGVGYEDVGAMDGFGGVVCGGKGAGGGGCVFGGIYEGEHGGGDGVGFRGGDGDVDAEFEGGEGEVVSFLLAYSRAKDGVDRAWKGTYKTLFASPTHAIFKPSSPNPLFCASFPARSA